MVGKMPSTTAWIMAGLLGFSLCLAGSAGAGGRDYTVELPNISQELGALLTPLSDCLSLQGSPPETPALLRRRMDRDLRIFSAALKSHGYFTATANAEILPGTPQIVRFHIFPGPRFSFTRPTLTLLENIFPPPVTVSTVTDLLAEGRKYTSKSVLDAETALLKHLQESGYPSPTIAERSVVADHATRLVSVHFHVKCGPRATFGPTRIIGLQHVLASVVRKHLAWAEGERFDSGRLDTTRARLLRTGLFRSVNVHADHAPQSDTVRMLVTVLEAPQRTLRYGLWYYSDQGAGVGAGWTHRNLWGAGHKFSLDTELSQKIQSAVSTFSLSNLLDTNQSLGVSTSLVHEKTIGYDSSSLTGSALLERDINSVHLGYGVGYRFSRVDNNEVHHFNLLSLPFRLEYSTVSTPLDPHSGTSLTLRLEPFAALQNLRESFLLWSIGARHYLPLTADNRFLLAIRGQYSLLAGTSREHIPDDLLLYAGGGGSIRGYAYQHAGRLDKDDEPLGGLSAVDFSAELRWRINRDFGAVLFSDGGRAFSRRIPDDEALFFSAGCGLRYFTPIGPLRVDLAIPLNRRDHRDEPIQVYFSLGQAF